MVEESISVGLPSVWGTQRSAESATITMKTIQARAIIARRFLRRRFHASPQSVRTGASDTVAAPSGATSSRPVGASWKAATSSLWR